MADFKLVLADELGEVKYWCSEVTKMKSNIEIGKKYDLVRQINGEDDGRKRVKITWIENRGEYLYIGFKVDDGSMSFGAFRQYKDKRPVVINYTLEPVEA